MACQKVCKQGRDDIKVKVNNYPISTSFYSVVCTSGMGLCIFTINFISSLPYMFFKKCHFTSFQSVNGCLSVYIHVKPHFHNCCFSQLGLPNFKLPFTRTHVNFTSNDSIWSIKIYCSYVKIL